MTGQVTGLAVVVQASNRILYLGRHYATTDCGRQLGAARTYVRDRYGTSGRAKAFWQANGWY
jgi:hypothetical protein